ncbi:uncharacterized protein LOC118529853 isoform X2 [Halichoerus grypus]
MNWHNLTRTGGSQRGSDLLSPSGFEVKAEHCSDLVFKMERTKEHLSGILALPRKQEESYPECLLQQNAMAELPRKANSGETAEVPSDL